ncbi:MAG: YafY family transcriptional regulator [Deltaproteobacteria bacterium]|nr:MAG: YafY family transcriptional regulator [Deltaproteobacteria bacterium]
MRRSDRLFQLANLLASRRSATGRELADELGVSLRTLYRDIAALQDAGVPLRGEAGVGYLLDRRHALPPITFTTSEVEALVLGTRILEAFGDPELAEAARSALAKIEGATPEPLREALGQTPLYALNFGPGPGPLAPLRRAIAERRVLRLAYVRADGEASTRRVRPLGLYFWGRTWSLAAWCELREAYRSFRPDRIDDVEVLDERFGPEVSLEAFVAAMRSGE